MPTTTAGLFHDLADERVTFKTRRVPTATSRKPPRPRRDSLARRCLRGVGSGAAWQGGVGLRYSAYFIKIARC